MILRLMAIMFILVCATVAWLGLSATLKFRTDEADSSLSRAVGELWGKTQHQVAPSFHYQVEQKKNVLVTVDNKVVSKEETELVPVSLPLVGSDIEARLSLDQRRKGLLWYATYKVGFHGRFMVHNTTPEAREVFVTFAFPASGATYDNFRLRVAGDEVTELKIANGKVRQAFRMEAGSKVPVEVSYDSQGLDQWWYDFGQNVNQTRDFRLQLVTDFDGFDFPESGISPTRKERRGGGWLLEWRYGNLLTDVKIGLEMPHRLNPGPWAAMVTAAAPVSLFLFFFLVFIFTTLRGIELHPMHYFFLAAAFFSFHLLLAYLVDHISIEFALVICSIVSLALVVSYMSRVAGLRFACLTVGTAQMIYLVLFSATFLLEGLTGLSITVLCIATLFVVMQMTARLDWGKVFRRESL
mgnify:CR=1 FL=1